jgi:hypothetical protein
MKSIGKKKHLFHVIDEISIEKPKKKSIKPDENE